MKATSCWILLILVLSGAFFYSSGLFLCSTASVPFPAFSAKLSVKLSSSPQSSSYKYYFEPAKELDLLLKILKFERNWKSRAGEFFVIGIVNQKSDSLSARLASDWLALNQTLSQQQINIYGLPISIIDLDVDSFPFPALEKKLQQESVNFVYFTVLNLKKDPDLIKNICRLCRKIKIGTFTDNPEYFETGMALCLMPDKDKPQIIINLEEAQAQGLSFSSRLLHLVKIRNANGTSIPY
ncbi:MAG: YfiR family protein [Acidobacteriota bacterium]|nr:YfiR family protein [Acidobacteriota bacterium]